jgi:membrane-bound serine protease (ClpP class)
MNIAESGGYEVDAIDSLRSALSDPSLAYLLLMLAVLGISVEILTPGLIFPSTIGIISGLFAFLALSTLPINPIGIILIFVSLGFFIAEAMMRTRGLITVFGLISIILGSIFLFKDGAANRANPFLMAGTTIVISAVLVFIANRVVAAQRKRISTGREEFKGSIAVVRTALNPEGIVFFQGELWKAALDQGSAAPGEEVIITGLAGLKLFVTKKRG